MKNRKLYSIFFLLGLSVVAMVAISYYYIDVPESSSLEMQVLADEDKTADIPNQNSMKNSWLGHIKNKREQKSYQYAVSEISLKLN